MKFQRHYLLSSNERFLRHLSALDSDFDHTKCDDRVTTAQRRATMVNIWENPVKSVGKPGPMREISLAHRKEVFLRCVGFSYSFIGSRLSPPPRSYRL